MKKDLSSVRQKLIEIKGVGPETADTILLYALDQPIFIIDKYTRRWSEKESFSSEKDYDKLQQLFQENLPQDLKTYRDFHALIIISQKGREESKMEIV